MLNLSHMTGSNTQDAKTNVVALVVAGFSPHYVASNSSKGKSIRLRRNLNTTPRSHEMKWAL